MTGKHTEYRPLAESDVRGFDGDSTALVLEAVHEGWIGRVSTKGHAILRAPDGETTMSIARDSKRARSGRNARAVLERYRRTEYQEIRTELPQPRSEFGALACSECGKGFTQKDHLDAHMRKHHPEKADMMTETIVRRGKDLRPGDPNGIEYGEFPCEECGRVFKLPGFLRRHMAAVHSEGEVLAPTEPVDDSEVGISPTGRPQSYKCEKCDRAFVGPGYLANHRRKNHGLIGPVILDAPNARFECPDCDRRFVSEDAYDEHRVDHARTAVVTCEKCQETFGSSLHLAAHRVREHSPQPVATAPAPVAAEETVSSAPVSVEASVLSEPETAAESAPETVRADAGELRTYVPLAPVVAQGEFACTEPGCGARFSTRFSLRAHTISHAQVLVCEVCGKSFTFITAHQAQAHSTVELAEAMFRMRTWCEETAAASEDAEARIALAREALGM